MKVVVIEPLAVADEKVTAIAKESLGNDVELVLYDNRATTEEELIARGKNADVVVVANQPLSGAVIRGFRNCKLLDIAFTGVDHVDIEACKEMGMTVCNCSGYSTEGVANLVFGMLIALFRNLSACDTATRNGKTKDGLVGHELAGMRFGVIGTGVIGLRVAEIAKAFGCEVVAYSRTKKEVAGVTYLPLEEVLKTSDIISLHMPNNASTKGMIGKEQIALMKESAVLINTARGPVLDSQALADALNKDKIAGACIDVFEMEPPIPGDHPLLSSKNTLLAPHVAFATKEAMVKRAYIVMDNIKAFQSGTPINVIK